MKFFFHLVWLGLIVLALLEATADSSVSSWNRPDLLIREQSARLHRNANTPSMALRLQVLAQNTIHSSPIIHLVEVKSSEISTALVANSSPNRTDSQIITQSQSLIITLAWPWQSKQACRVQHPLSHPKACATLSLDSSSAIALLIALAGMMFALG